jgi:hypothetical protein
MRRSTDEELHLFIYIKINETITYYNSNKMYNIIMHNFTIKTLKLQLQHDSTLFRVTFRVYASITQGDKNVSVHLMITAQKKHAKIF